MALSPERLRHYYEHAYGRTGPSKAAFDGCTFEEYYQLRCIETPGVSRWNAAIRAPSDEFRELAANYPEDEPKSPASVRHHAVRRKASLDLCDITLGPEERGLLLDRVKQLSGIDCLAGTGLTSVSVLFGDTSDTAPADRLSVEQLVVQECTDRCLAVLLAATSSQSVKIAHYDRGIVDLRLLAGHVQLEDLAVAASHVRGLAHLEAAPLRELLLSNIELDEHFVSLLESKRNTLRRLWIENFVAFGPDAFASLGSMSILSEVRISAGSRFRDHWIDFAVEHPNIGFQFVPLKEPPAKTPFIELAEIHQGVEIYRVRRGTTESFRVSGNLAGDWLDSDRPNTELADVIEQAEAKKAGLTIDASSDVLTISSKGVENLRWCIDHLSERFLRD